MHLLVTQTRNCRQDVKRACCASRFTPCTCSEYRKELLTPVLRRRAHFKGEKKVQTSEKVYVKGGEKDRDVIMTSRGVITVCTRTSSQCLDLMLSGPSYIWAKELVCIPEDPWQTS
jgi:hypothetical protein